MSRRLAAVLALGLIGCTAKLGDSGRSDPTVDVAEGAVDPVRSPPAAVEPPGYAACAQKMASVVLSPGEPGTPLLDGQRAGLLARSMSHPSVFTRTPRRSEEPMARALWERIESAASAAYALYDAYPTIVASRERARAVLLREGYLFADETGLGLGLATVVRLEQLFREPTVYIQRGAAILTAGRRKAGPGHAYFYEDGPEAGNVAQILLFDRVATERQALAEPLHFDLVPLQRELGFDEGFVRHVTARAVVVDLRYDGAWVSTLLSREGAAVSLECELASGALAERVARVRSAHARRERALARQREVIYTQIVEGLPFDEPRTEVGQQDGKLRQEWLWAYRRGATRFEFNEDRYFVFDAAGRPRVPQVCIDFIRDTYERAGGSWFQSRGEPRERLPGAIDFRQFEIENDRSVESFVAFAESRPEWFEVAHLPEERRVPLIRRGEFYATLQAHRHDFAPGDVVTILGLRDDGKLHYHSFFVFMSDPVTGMPTLLAANAGRPRIRSWEGEMRNAPFRSIKTRVRPTLRWLERVVPSETPTSAREALEPGAAPI